MTLFLFVVAFLFPQLQHYRTRNFAIELQINMNTRTRTRTRLTSVSPSVRTNQHYCKHQLNGIELTMISVSVTTYNHITQHTPYTIHHIRHTIHTHAQVENLSESVISFLYIHVWVYVYVLMHGIKCVTVICCNLRGTTTKIYKIK